MITAFVQIASHFCNLSCC